MAKVILYHADWCGHCKRFKPIWDGMKTDMKAKGISYEEYEDGMNPQVIQRAGVLGFPTLRISANGEEHDYEGPRTKDAIINAALQYGGQSGGGENYRHKYMKYKQKYLDLLRNRH